MASSQSARATPFSPSHNYVKKVKFGPKSEHKVHVLERVGDGDNDSSDEDFVEGDSSDDDKAEGNGLVMA